MTAWDAAFAFVVGEEGKLSLDPKDRGNWTGGVIGQGELRGTKYGISAAQFPQEDIPALTAARAKQLAKPLYWDPMRCDELPASVATVAFDAAYNMGVHEATLLLQRACGVPVDGKIGGMTMLAASANPAKVCKEFCAQRIISYSEMPLWGSDGLGWTRRVLDGLLKEVAAQ